MRIDGALAALEAVAVHLGDQFASRKNAAGAGGECEEDVELATGQLDRGTVETYLSRRPSDRERAPAAFFRDAN